MTETIKAAIIGAGILGSQHAATLQAHPDATLLAVADVRLDAAERLAAVYGVQAYDDYVEMLRRQHPDLVIVATPDALHREPVIAALEAGTPCVIQEKPLATTRQDAEAIYEAVEKR
ncbi:MAG: Gfo/Idh/MocA family protein, partial [Anaerolineae bacterium]